MERDFRVGAWEVQPLRNRIVGPEGPVKLEPRVMRLLVLLAERTGSVVSREELTEKLWEGAFVTDEVLTQSVSELRKALGDDPKEPRFVQTVPRQGYRLIGPVEADSGEPVGFRDGGDSVSRGRVGAGVLLGLLAIAAVAWVFRSPEPPEPPRQPRLAIQLPDGATYIHPSIAISRDGDRVAFTAATGSGDRLFVRSLDRLEATVLARDMGLPTFMGTNICFSPDGAWVAFAADGTLWKVGVGGGTPIRICDAAEAQGIHWGEDDTIVFGVVLSPSVLKRVPASAGIPETLITSSGREFFHFPFILPGGKAVLFALGRSLYDSSVAVLDLGTNETKILTDGSVPRYLESGHLMFSRGDSVFVAPFDVDRLELKGSVVPVLDRNQIHFRGSTHEAAFSVSASGTLVYAPSVDPPERKPHLVDISTGRETPLDLRPPVRGTRFPRFSPDGRRMLVDDGRDVWIYDLELGTASVLRSDGSLDYRPIWTREGDHAVFVSNRDSGGDLFMQIADGTEPATNILRATSTIPAVFAPDGSVLLYQTQGSGLWDIWALPMDGSGEPSPYLNERYSEVEPYFSPDGRWVAYSSNETGEFEVYVRRFPDGRHKKTISTRGGQGPLWSPDGGTLFYWQHDQLMAVPLKATEPEIVPGEPVPLLRGEVGPPGGNRTFDLHPDGRRVVMYAKPSEPPTLRTHLVVVQNWFVELRSLTGTEN